MKIAARSAINLRAFGTMLFDLERDPRQEESLIDEGIERRMVGLMVELLRRNDAPAEQYERLGLPAEGEVRDAHLLLAAQRGLVERAKDVRPPAR